MIILIYLISFASFIGAVVMLWEYIQGNKCHTWPSTTGVIVQSKMVSPKGNKKEKTNFIYYKYSVNGKEHHSRRLAMHLTTLFKNNEAAKLLEKYPVDKEVIVRYHPFFNGFAVLETGQKQTAIRVFMFIIFFLFFAISMQAILFPGYNPVFELIMKSNNA